MVHLSCILSPRVLTFRSAIFMVIRIEMREPHQQIATPDDTAVRVALWRALHLQADAPPHVFEDEVGLKLVAPDADWRTRPDMGPFTKPFRASILGRARFIEDLVAEKVADGVGP